MTDMTQPDSKKYGRPDDERIIPFMKIAKPAAIFSIILTIASLFFIVTKGCLRDTLPIPIVASGVRYE